ncbi:MAG TPA: NAD-dependent epimerase/dehydratase family protein [Deltaproteobacteria bacterium]|nr:NAD-dependent epimerase/dehydratase family protein [Deltaproteobacteria bacterium]
MNALVTGATGFIGSVLCRMLVIEGHKIRVLALPGEDTQALLELGAEIRYGNLLDKEGIKGICKGIHTVFHLAARVTDWGSREQFSQAIYDSTVNLMVEAAGSAKRFLYVSSIAAIGLGRHMKGIKEGDPVFRSGIPYNDAKLDAERLVMAFHETGLVACTIVRPANVTGPGSLWVRDIIEKMLMMPMPLIDGGRHSASLIYVDNLVDGIIRAATSEKAKGKIYHLMDDWDVTWKQYINDLGALVGKKSLGSLPYPVARMLGSVMDLVCTPLNIRPAISRMAADITGRNNDVDTTLAQSELGWKTKITYPEAMDKISAWVRETYKI